LTPKRLLTPSVAHIRNKQSPVIGPQVRNGNTSRNYITVSSRLLFSGRVLLVLLLLASSTLSRSPLLQHWKTETQETKIAHLFNLLLPLLSIALVFPSWSLVPTYCLLPTSYSISFLYFSTHAIRGFCACVWEGRATKGALEVAVWKCWCVFVCGECVLSGSVRVFFVGCQCVWQTAGCRLGSGGLLQRVL